MGKQLVEENYSSIETAFAAGTGDQIFEKSGRYLATSRHQDPAEILAAGYRLLRPCLDYDLKRIVTPARMTFTQTVGSLQVILRTDGNYTEGYFDEYPDAYNNLL